MSSQARPREFKTTGHLERWLRVNHAVKKELWVRVFKKGSQRTSVTWDEIVVGAIAWGWIDSQKKGLDEVSYLQRLTPRRANSNWSRRNCRHAEDLMARGAMQPPGQLLVDAARQSGRWDQAYAGSADMVIPEDFLAELRKDGQARQFYDTLDRRNLFAIYHRIHTARRPETRRRWINKIVARLAKGEAFHS